VNSTTQTCITCSNFGYKCHPTGKHRMSTRNKINIGIKRIDARPKYTRQLNIEANKKRSTQFLQYYEQQEKHLIAGKYMLEIRRRTNTLQCYDIFVKVCKNLCDVTNFKTCNPCLLVFSMMYFSVWCWSDTNETCSIYWWY